MKTKITLIFILAVALLNNSLAQTTVTIQPNAIAGKDVCIWSNAPGNYNPDYYSLTSYGWTNSGNPGIKRSLLEFDLTTLPANITILNARLSLRYNPTDIAESVDFHSGNNAALLQRIVSPWNEASVDWNTQPASTTQNEVTLPQSTSGTQDYLNMDVTALVADMVNDLANSHGFMLKLINENPYNILIFASSDNGDASKHPMLEITYNINCTNVILQPNSVLGKDACIWSNAPATNQDYESLTSYGWTNSGNPGIKRLLVEFDLSTLPANAAVTDAKLSFYYNPTDGVESVDFHSGNNSALLQRIVIPWNESGVTWNTQPSTTVQNEVILLQSISGTQDYLNMNVTALVADMVNDLANSHGFMLKLIDENPYNILIFASSDNANSALHPKLEICYTVTTGVVEMSNNNNTLPLSPNPSSNTITISGMKSALKRIEIYNVLGEKVSSENISDGSCKHTITISSLNSGIYFVKAIGEREERVAKFVKE